MLGVSLDSVVWCASGQVVFGVSIDFVVKGISGSWIAVGISVDRC